MGPFEVRGLLDGYYGLNLNRPADRLNGLRDFDDHAQRLELNMASLTVNYSPRPVGIHVTAGDGRAYDIMGSTEKDATGMRFFEEAYVAVKPNSQADLQFDLGKFASWASAEVIETPNNWNYSRSLLFVWCTPYDHFGVRATAPVRKHLSAGIQLVSGWNNIITGATYRTVGLTASWMPTARLSWTNTYYGGPDENTSDRGLRNLYDGVLQRPGAKASFYLNVDYLRDSPQHAPSYQTYGMAGAASLHATRKLSLSPRLEWLHDESGMVTGARKQVKEFTATGRYALLSRLSAWMEFRNDWSGQPIFRCANPINTCGHQPTVLVGVVAELRPEE